MFPSVTFLLCGLLATTVFARRSGLADRTARREAQTLLSDTKTADGHHTTNSSSTNLMLTDPKENWAGPVFTIPKGQVRSVSGTLYLPTISAPENAPPGTTWAASAWVGIDGSTTESQSLLQAGIDFKIVNGVAIYEAWYEWWPEDLIPINLAFAAGQKMFVFVMADNVHTGTIYMKNVDTGMDQTIVVHAARPDDILLMETAEWIVETIDDEPDILGICDFGTMMLSDALAVTIYGQQLGPGNGDTTFKVHDLILDNVIWIETEVYKSNPNLVTYRFKPTIPDTPDSEAL